MTLATRIRRAWRRHDERLVEQGLYSQAFGNDPSGMLGNTTLDVGSGPGGTFADPAGPADPPVDANLLREAERVDEEDD